MANESTTNDGGRGIDTALLWKEGLRPSSGALSSTILAIMCNMTLRFCSLSPSSASAASLRIFGRDAPDFVASLCVSSL